MNLIRLSKGLLSDAGGSAKQLPSDTVTVACPDHLVLADLPVAKSIGAITSSSLVKSIGRKSRRQLGERVHFCVRCDFPIAIYGRLSPCEHAFCLDCARSDLICYLCDERIQKIQTIKLMEGIFICAAPHCLKSFLKRTDFESHIQEMHADLLQPNLKEDGKESEVQSAKQTTGSDSTVRGPPRSIISPGSNPQTYDTEDKASRQQPREQQPREQQPPRPMVQPKGPPLFGQIQNFPSEPQPENNRPPGFDRPGPHNQFQQGFDTQGTPQSESSQFSDKQQGLFPEYPPMHSMQPPNFVMPMNSNPGLTPYGVPQFPNDAAQPFYGAPFEMARPSSTPDVGSEQGSLLGFPPGVNYPTGYPQPWNGGQPGVPFEAPSGSHMMADAFANYQGDYGRNPSGLPVIPPQPSANKGMEALQGSNTIDPRDGKGILAPQPMQVPPPPPPLPHHMPPHKRAKLHSGDMGRDPQGYGCSQGYGWQHENRDGYGGIQE